jgi:RNA recognition motif-containing protein
MPNDAEGRAAVEALDSTEFEGRPLRVSEAQSQGERRDDSARSRW